MGLTGSAAIAALTHVVAGDLYVALFTEMPAYDGTGGAEVDVPGYARTLCSNWSTQLDQEAAVFVRNGAPVAFPELQQAVANVVGFGLYKVQAGGGASDLVAYGDLATFDGQEAALAPASFEAGDSPVFPANSLLVALADLRVGE